jgi:2-phosphosulfolactate phosphatase
MPRNRVVSIDYVVEALPDLPVGALLVCVDVLRSTTTAVTAVANGHRCIPVATIEEAEERAAELGEALLVGELGGNMPFGFDLTNSPAAVTACTERHRPVVLLSTSGTRVLCEARDTGSRVYVGSLRNVSALARRLEHGEADVALLGAATRGEFREEDQLCSGWLAARLIDAGFVPRDESTRSLVARWRDQPADAIASSRSVDYLSRTGQLADYDFVLAHVDDLDDVFVLAGTEVVKEQP